MSCPKCLSIPCKCVPEDALTKQIMDAGEQPLMLDEARKIVYGQRQKDYGPARENHENIARFWSAVLGIPITPEQVVLCMIGLKMARLSHSPNHRDSWVDIAGYVGVADKMERGE